MTVAASDPSGKISASVPSVRECLRAMATPIQYLKGVGPKRAEQLESIGIRTVEDLLYHLPFRYEDRRSIKKICDAALGEECSFVGRLPNCKTATYRAGAAKCSPARCKTTREASILSGIARPLFWSMG